MSFFLKCWDFDRLFLWFAEGKPSASAGQPSSGAGKWQSGPQIDHQQGGPEEHSRQGTINYCPFQKGSETPQEMNKV